MFKELTHANLLQVQCVIFYPNGKSISLSTSDKGNSDDHINLDPSGQDSKKSDFNLTGFHFVVRLIEHFTSYQFKLVRHDEQMVVFARTEKYIGPQQENKRERCEQEHMVTKPHQSQPQPHSKMVEYRCGCGASITAVDETRARELRSVHALSCRGR